MDKKIFLGKICCLVFLASTFSIPTYAANIGAFSEHYNAGQNYFMQNQYSSSIVEFRKALRINYLDNSARIGLINAFLARATYYANQSKDFEKAANDFRSALFYLKIYPLENQNSSDSTGVISSATSNLNQCLKVLSYDTTPNARYKKAEELRAIGNLSAAAYEFSKVQSDKLIADANTQIGDLLKLLGNEPRSIDYYKLALSQKPNDSVLRMKYARSLDKIGKYDEAVSQYNSALANSKDDMEVLYALERIYLKKLAVTPSDAELNTNIGAIKQAQGDLEAALNYYNKAEQLNPNNVTTRINVGTLYQQKKDYMKALEAYDSVLTLYPNNTQALAYKAQAYSEMGDKESALKAYRRLLAVEPNNSIAKDEVNNILMSKMSPAELITYLSQNSSESELYDYAYKLHKNNDVDNAIAGYKAVIAKYPNNSDAYVNLAICYASKENYQSAISTLNTAKSKFPNNSQIAKILSEVKNDSISSVISNASTAYEAKNYNKAIEEYLKVEPATEDSMLGIAASYQAMEQYPKAIEYYKKAELINPKNAEIPYYIGYLYSEQQKWVEAEGYLRKAIKINPNSDAKNLLPYVVDNNNLTMLNQGIDLFEKKNLQGALQKFNEVIKKDVANAYALYYRAMIYDEQKQNKLAISDYLNVLKNSEEFPIANYMLAVDYDTLANYKEALKYYKNFIAKYQTNDEYKQYAESRVKELSAYAG